MSPKKYKIPKLETHIFPPNEYVLEHQVSVFMQTLIGGGKLTASYVYRSVKRNNVVVIFLDGVLMSAKFKGMKFIEKLSESVAHEIFHSHIWQEFHKQFYGDELFANAFAEKKPGPPPMQHKANIECNKCGKKSYWDICPVCSVELFA